MKKLTFLVSLILAVSLSGCNQSPATTATWPNGTLPDSSMTTQQIPVKTEPPMVLPSDEENQKLHLDLVTPVEETVVELETPEDEEPEMPVQIPVNSEELYWEGFGSLHVKSYCLIDNDGDSLIVVTADMTNLHPEMDLSAASLGPTAYQSGVRLTQDHYTSYEKDVYTQIKSGATLEVCIVYQLRDTATPVEIELGADSITPSGQPKPTGLCTIPLQ